MKSTSKCICIIVSTVLFATCMQNKYSETLPFKAEYLGNYTNVYVDKDKCGDYPEMRVIVDGKGTGTLVGNSKLHFDFCSNMETGIYGYDKTYGCIVASTGDTLFVTCSGRIIEGRADNHPDHVISYWKDSLYITGGTGRFKGASGGGVMNDYNSSLDSNSHHQWSGTITLIKAKGRKH